MGSYAEEEMLVLWKRNDPGEFAVKMLQRLPLNYHQGVLNASATANNGGIPTEEEWTNYGHSMWKKAYTLWVCLDPRHKQDPQTKQPLALIDGVQWALKILYAALQHSQEKLDELMIKIQIVSQEDAIKNWCGPTDQGASAGQEATQPEKQSPTEAGLGYSDTASPNTEWTEQPSSPPQPISE
jgi:hypothetical protein